MVKCFVDSMDHDIMVKFLHVYDHRLFIPEDVQKKAQQLVEAENARLAKQLRAPLPADETIYVQLEAYSKEKYGGSRAYALHSGRNAATIVMSDRCFELLPDEVRFDPKALESELRHHQRCKVMDSKGVDEGNSRVMLALHEMLDELRTPYNNVTSAPSDDISYLNYVSFDNDMLSDEKSGHDIAQVLRWLLDERHYNKDLPAVYRHYELPFAHMVPRPSPASVADSLAGLRNSICLSGKGMHDERKRLEVLSDEALGLIEATEGEKKRREVWQEAFWARIAPSNAMRAAIIKSDESGFIDSARKAREARLEYYRRFGCDVTRLCELEELQLADLTAFRMAALKQGMGYDEKNVSQIEWIARAIMAGDWQALYKAADLPVVVGTPV